MIDGAVLAGYLAVGATRATGRVFDDGADALFERLSQRVEQRLGGRAVSDVELNPGDAERQVRLGRGIDAVARTDPQLAREFVALQNELDRTVGRQLIDAVQAHPDEPTATERTRPAAPALTDHSTAPRWVRVLVVAGIVVCLVGFGMALFDIVGVIGSMSGAAGVDAASSETPKLDTALPGFGVFFAGIAIVVVGNISRSRSGRR